MTERSITFPDDLKPKWIDRFVADVHAHIRGVTSLENETYPAPYHGWICFHCGERFTTKEGAALHFGTVNDERPDCIERLRDALTKLSNEVFGSLPLIEPVVRQQIGNTNYNILIQRAEEARAALSSTQRQD